MSLTKEELDKIRSIKNDKIRESQEKREKVLDSCSAKLVGNFIKHVTNNTKYSEILNIKWDLGWCYDGSQDMGEKFKNDLSSKFGNELKFVVGRKLQGNTVSDDPIKAGQNFDYLDYSFKRQ